jgi:hypothetical protein
VSDRIDPLAERKRENLLAQLNAANTFGKLAKEHIDEDGPEGRADATTTKANWLLEQLQPILSASFLLSGRINPANSAARRSPETQGCVGCQEPKLSL